MEVETKKGTERGTGQDNEMVLGWMTKPEGQPLLQD